MADLPTGTVTFLFTDIEGSTKLAQAHPVEWEAARQRHHTILSEATKAYQGYVFQVIGDAFCVAFPTASHGLQAALAAQRALQAEAWGGTPIRVRMGLHTGAAESREGDYHGYLTLAHVQRVMSAANGGQTLVSNATAGLLSGQLSDGVTLRDMADAVLHAGQELRILASSREALGIAGEHAYRVPSLGVPDATMPFDSLSHVASVQLFCERAQAAKGSFVLTSANAPAIRQICSRLDGIPLAIELAAARAKVFPPEQISARLDDRFRLLTGGSRTAMPRQQTLRALIDWSYALLSEPERVLFRRLSVFAGACTFEAAEAVCASDGIEPDDILDLLTHLVEKSLVVSHEANAEARYRMLETIRQYARDKLLESNEGDAVRSRHLTFFAHFAAAAAPGLDGPEQGRWLDRLEAEHDNLRAAIEWSSHDGNPVIQLQLSATLVTFWYIHGYHTEAVETLRHALSNTEGRSEMPQVMQARMQTIIALNTVLFGQGKFSEARPSAEEAVALAERFGDRVDRADAYRWRGIIAAHLGNYIESHDWLVRGLEVIGDSDERNMRAQLLWALGDEAYLQSDYARARPFYVQSETILREKRDKNRQAYSLRRLGQIAIHQGELGQARTFMAEALAINVQIMEPQGLIGCLAALAALGEVRSQWIRAVTLFGCVSALLSSL